MLLLEVKSQKNMCCRKENHQKKKTTIDWEKKDKLKKMMVDTIQQF